MRFWFLALFVLSLVGCPSKGGDDGDKKSKSEEDDDSSSKKKKKKKSEGESGSASAKATSAPDAKNPAPAAAPAPTPAPAAAGMPDFPALFGAKGDGWLPKVFAALKAGMTPAEAGAVIKGAEQVNEFGLSKVLVSDVPGVHSYHFSFLDGKLAFAEIWFRQELFTPDFKTKLVEACKARWGESEPVKPEDNFVMWIDPDFKSLTVGDIIDLDLKGYELKIAL